MTTATQLIPEDIDFSFLQKKVDKSNLTPIDIVVPFFEDSKPKPKLCKVYNDGGHYIAVPYFPSRVKQIDRSKSKSVARELFDSLYAQTIINDMSKAESKVYLQDNLCHLFDTEEELNEFITEERKRKLHNLHSKKNRFRRKAHLNKWTYFITLTYDDAKHTEEDFRKKLRRCLCNLHTRRGWRYMGVFERAPESGRLHFHGLLYVPSGEMFGKIAEKRDYSTKSQKMQTTHENDFFAERFGRNDFEELEPTELRYGQTISYILKYIEKSGERITYSRGIPTEILKRIDEKDVATDMKDFVLKYVLFDDVIDWETDVMHFNKEQMTFDDILYYRC